MECKMCGTVTEDSVLKKKRFICPECKAYMRIGAYDRISMVVDKGSFSELFTDVQGSNPLNTPGYEQKIIDTQAKSGLSEAVITGTGTIHKEPAVFAVCDTAFLMGSMGHVVGEKVTRAIEYATRERLPIFIFCASGGARMQEGIVSLMQMEKTSAALKRHDNAGLFSCTILTNPTTGGVTASFAMLADVIIAEPGALIGFAGPRVVEQTMGQKLPIGFQSAEFQVDHGMVDGIVERKNLSKMLYFFMTTHKTRTGYTNFNTTGMEYFRDLSMYRAKESADVVSQLGPWDRVKLQRSAKRRSALDYVRNVFDAFVELKGDRYYGNDDALICGIGLLNMQPVTVITANRGTTPEEMVRCNFGMPLPEGYRKALRLMREAEKFNRPIVTFVNTPGAHCGIEAEERGQGMAIAKNLYEMAEIKVPILSIITGEAGSGGALATAVANQVWMLENATYSIISPEGYAAIVFKDSTKAAEAAKDMHITAEELKNLGICEKIIPEFIGEEGEVEKTSKYIKDEIIKFLMEMNLKTPEMIADERYNRFRKF